MEPTTSFTAQIRALIANDNFAEAIRQLHNLLEGSPALNEVLLQSARFSDVMRQIRLGVVDYEQANITKNQIRMGILELLDEIEAKEKAMPDVKQELERYAAKIVNQHAGKIYNIEKIDNANFS